MLAARLLEVIGVDDESWNDQASFHFLPLLGCHDLQQSTGIVYVDITAIAVGRQPCK